jgi:hypothetical protein
MRDNLAVVARPKEVYQSFMVKGLVCRTNPKAAKSQQGGPQFHG